MKTLFASICLLIACLSAFAQAPPVFEATTNQVAAGLVGAPFYVSPRGLVGAGIGSPTNGISGAQAQALIDTSSNSIYGNGVTQINTTSNSLNTSINTSSNSTLANAQTAINTSSNSVLGTAQTRINTSSNSVYGSALTQINTTSNTLAGQISAGGITAANLKDSLATGTNSVNLTNSAAGTLPKSAADASWMPLTNAVAYSNSSGLPVIGNALVIVGTNTFGAIVVNPTNWPSSSGGGISALYATNDIIYDTNTINGQAFRVDTNGVMHISTNGVDVVSVGTNGMAIAAGSSNWFGTTVTVQGGLGTTRSNLLAPTALSFPATTVNWTNPINTSIIVSIDNSAVTGTAIKKNGTTIFSSITGDASVGLQPGEYFSQTYTIGTPTATWYPFP